MKVIVQGQGEVTLTQREFVASGGEGSIYSKGVTAYKVYTDPSRMLPVGKIAELAAIHDPDVIKPEKVLLDPKGNRPIGYTMRFVSDAVPLCQTFTRAYRDREGLDHATMFGLVRTLQERVDHIHQAGMLVVDLNEMNFLVDKGHQEVYAIDVDSYQTKSYPATAIMPSVRDWTVQGHDFTELSDWFSFACVAYTMFRGIHPYKGKHPTIHGLEERMRANASAFDPSVTVPKVAYPEDVIPPAYRAWFRAVLQDGKRLPPPTDPNHTISVTLTPPTFVAGAGLTISDLLLFQEDILAYEESGGVAVVGTATGIYLGTRKVLGPTPVRAIGFSPKNNRPIAAWVEGGRLRLHDLVGGRAISLDLVADALMGYHGRIYVRTGERLLEIVLTDMSSGVVASTRNVANVLEKATHVYPGVVVQNLLGSVFVHVFPRAGASHQIRVPDLDGVRIVDARHDGRILMVVASVAGRFDRLTFLFAEDYDTYQTLPVVRDITPSGLNFVTLDSGVLVHLTEVEEIEVVSLTSGKTRTVRDPALGNDMRLVQHAGRVAFIRGSKVCSMSLR